MTLLKIGEVARRTGVTVRALHHYDRLGLLVPSSRSEAGYRLYTRNDLIKLQKLKSLQQLGFSLEDIQQAIDGEEFSLAVIIQRQLELTQSQIKQLQKTVRRLQIIVDRISVNQQVNVDSVCDLLKEMTMFEKYFSEEQLQKIEQRRQDFGEEAIENYSDSWADIFDNIKEVMVNNKPANSSEAIKLGKQALELIDLFTGGDSEMQLSLDRMYDTEGGAKMMKRQGYDVNQEQFDFLSEAMKYAKKC